MQTGTDQAMRVSEEGNKALAFQISNDRRVCTNCEKFKVCMLWRGWRELQDNMFPTLNSDSMKDAPKEEYEAIKKSSISPIATYNMAKICSEFIPSDREMMGV